MSLDQFYTKKSVAKKCYNTFKKKVDISTFDIFLEPSAGTGSFFKLLPKKKRVGLDLDPKFEGIKKKDFLKFVSDDDTKYAVIGNPPFGKISSIAVEFFNKSAEFADVIAFILPRTFKRVSIQNQLDLNFHLLYSKDLPLKPCCFTPSMSAKCAFQIWEKRLEKRNIVVYDKTHPDFSFVKLGPKDNNNQPTPPTTADFALKAYGSHCGQIIVKDLKNLRPKSWHWIKSNIDLRELKQRFRSLDYSMSTDTVRQDSIGQQELIYLYKCNFD